MCFFVDYGCPVLYNKRTKKIICSLRGVQSVSEKRSQRLIRSEAAPLYGAVLPNPLGKPTVSTVG